MHIRTATRNNLKKFSAILSLFILTLNAVVPVAVNAAQVENRQLQLESSAAGATTGHDFSFDIATSDNVGGFVFEYCSNDPFPDEPCNAPSGFDASSFTVDAQTGASGFTKDSTNTTTNEIAVSNATPQSFTAGDTVTFDFGSVVNPDQSNTEYFVRIYTYTDDTYSTKVDDGGLAFSTAETIQVTARVQETLAFCVYTGANCSEGGNESDLGILNTTITRTAESYFDVATNARNGVTIQYVGDTLTSGSFSITAFNGGDGTPATSTTGTEQFGLRVADATTGGQNASIASPFDTMAADEYALDTSNPQSVGTSSGPVEETKFTIEYAANVEALTETGVYDTNIEYIATATF